MEIAMILKLNLLLVSQKSLKDHTVHMELPDSLLQVMKMGSGLLLPLPGAPRADLLRPLKQKSPKRSNANM